MAEAVIMEQEHTVTEQEQGVDAAAGAGEGTGEDVPEALARIEAEKEEVEEIRARIAEVDAAQLRLDYERRKRISAVEVEEGSAEELELVVAAMGRENAARRGWSVGRWIRARKERKERALREAERIEREHRVSEALAEMRDAEVRLEILRVELVELQQLQMRLRGEVARLNLKARGGDISGRVTDACAGAEAIMIGGRLSEVLKYEFALKGQITDLYSRIRAARKRAEW